MYSAARMGGPIVKNKLFFFVSDETTRQRTFNGNAQGQTGTSGFVSLPPADLRRGDFSNTATPIYDPLTGNPTTGVGRVPFAFANCGLTSTADPRFASCNFIPANRINPISAAMLAKLVQPTQPGIQNNYFVVNGYDTTYHKIDAKITYNPGPKLNLNARMGFLPSWERSLGILPAIDGSSVNPLVAGTRVGLVRRQPFDRRDDDPVCRASWSTARSATRSTTSMCFRRWIRAMATCSAFRMPASRRTRSTPTCPT